MPEPFELVVAAVISLVASIIQGTVGLGFAVFSVPILTLIDPALTPIPQLFLALPISASAAWRERRDADLSGIGWIVAGRIPGAMLGAWTLLRVAEATLDVIIAVIVLAAVIALARGAGFALSVRNRTLAGFASGFTGTTSAIGGPPLALLYRNSPSATVRSSLGLMFAIGIVINLFALYSTGAVEPLDYRITAILLAPSLLGFALSGRLRRFMEGRRVTVAIFAISVLAALGLLVRGLTVS